MALDTIDIADPGDEVAPLKAAIQALVPISTVTISSPVNYVDIDLPSGFSAFRLVIANLGGASMGATAFSPTFWGAFSQNAGVTWLEDFDGAWEAYYYVFLTCTAATVVTGDSGSSAGLDFGWGADDKSADFVIVPGSASKPALLFGNVVRESTTDRGIQLVRHSCSLNTDRVNAIRLLPYDGGEYSPSEPTAGTVMSYGSFSLYGVV